MGARRAASGVKDMTVKVTSASDEQRARIIGGIGPWLIWLVALPFAALIFSLLHLGVPNPAMVIISLWAGTAVITWTVWKFTGSRSGIGRGHHIINTVGCLSWVNLVVMFGPLAFQGGLIVMYLVGGLVGCIVWKVRYSRHTDRLDDVLESPKGKKRHRRKLIDGGYMVRAAADRVPAIRRGAAALAGPFPVVATPWEAPRELTSGQQALTAGPVTTDQEAQDEADAQEAWRRLQLHWREFTRVKYPTLNGARLVPLDIKPYRIRTKVNLVRGVQVPGDVEGARELLASQTGMPPSSIQPRPNKLHGGQAFIDFVLIDSLKESLPWPGPTHIGQSIAAAPTAFGLYEDRVLAQVYEAAITTAELAKRVGMTEKNLSHTLIEGMTGSGKSNYARITVTDGATRLDLVDLVIDTVKKFQTMGPIAGAFDWFAWQKAEAQALIRFLLDLIAEMAAYLGAHGYDNWQEGCGLPLVRVTIEEGGIIANELDKLDDVMNSARSAGVVMRVAFQRAHHGLADTNVRAAFGSSLIHGVKTLDDTFAMDEELLAAGCDPSIWKDKQPGMAYYSAPGLSIERMVMASRSFKFDPVMGAAIVDEYAPMREQWIRENCPDWFKILAKVDRNGVYAKRTTGAAVRKEVLEIQRAKASGARNQGSIIDMGGAGRHRATADVATDDYQVEVIGTEPAQPPVADQVDEAPAAPINAEEAIERPTFDELENELDDDLAEAARQDLADGIDARAHLEEMDPEEEFAYPPREPGSKLAKEEALEATRRYLAGKGAYFKFRPRDVYDDLCGEQGITGLSASWVRVTALPTLVAQGALHHDKAEGVYTVEEKINDIAFGPVMVGV
ncbi:hypothetical protein ACFFMN_23190 [Planobispora siamensis]|uniref:Uncharacterized protein n=1 Tax=Planobispora siamensis TaxID=936338 RepID=A0A8J3WP62_9ACTN|nr:hypothetical protein [Planobispora siamensis]GIH95267.1 hypothetical protein Psi01_58970 [Planobispora siamensis]